MATGCTDEDRSTLATVAERTLAIVKRQDEQTDQLNGLTIRTDSLEKTRDQQEGAGTAVKYAVRGGAAVGGISGLGWLIDNGPVWLNHLFGGHR